MLIYVVIIPNHINEAYMYTYGFITNTLLWYSPNYGLEWFTHDE